MFEHSVKVPRHYKIAANIFKKVSLEGGSVKTLLYDDKLRHFRTNVLYALITETIKHAADIDKIFESCNILEKESRLDPWLAKVLTAELLFGKKILPGKSKPEQTVLSYKDLFEKYITDNQDDLKTEAICRPRYVRVNTNLLTTSDAIRAFQDEGYRFIRCTSGSYDDYLEQIQRLTEEDFTQDYHVKTVFVFSAGTKLHEHELYLENKIILQDKATAMAVHLLAPPPGSVVLDMCAAPGMKTTQTAAYMRNEGKIYAVERNEKRYQTLSDFVEKTGSKCVQTMLKDSLEIKRGDLDDVEYILLDPSCSGSGMELCVHNYIDATRLAKLTSLQEKFLKHAMNSFPNAKRIVYSTCSLFSEENERVITNVVKTSRAKWRVQDVKELLKGKWNNFGSAMYGSVGTRCMYAKPDSDLTIGFFLAVLDRDEKDLRKSQKNNAAEEVSKKEVSSNSIPTDNQTKGSEDTVLNDASAPEETEIKSKKKNKKSKKHKLDFDNEKQTLTEELVVKKKNKKDKSKDHVDMALDQITDMNSDHEKQQCKKKRKKENELETHIIKEVADIKSGHKKKKKKSKQEYENNEDMTLNHGIDIENKNENILVHDQELKDTNLEVPRKKKKKLK